MQDPREIEAFYGKPDPWGYQTNPEDENRKRIIMELLREQLKMLGKERYDQALDIGAGEAWITKDLPAKRLYGYELSDNAAMRFPKNVLRVQDQDLIREDVKFDLVIATGVLYGHYDWPRFVEMIRRHATGTVLLCNILDWRVPAALTTMVGAGDFVLVHGGEFKYREYTEEILIYETAAQHRGEAE